MSDQIDQYLGHYQIIGLLGQGATATVYRARQANIKRDVALKAIKPDLENREDFIKRFEHEAETIASLSHPHILKIFDYGQQNDVVFLVMELLNGGTLSDMLRRGPIDLFTTSRIVYQIASALTYAHKRNIVHRDLKPQNVLFDDNGNAFLADFGLSTLVSADLLVQSETAIGTPAYMAPEQWQGKQVDAQTDIYALGLILFEMLTGKKPFDSDTIATVMYKHLNEMPPSLAAFQLELASTLDPILKKTLAKKGSDRYESAIALAEEFHIAVRGTEPIITQSQAVAQERNVVAQIEAERLSQQHRTPPRSRFINSLPQDVNARYVGRAKEQADVIRLIMEKTRLISIYGRSGVGKTALACKVLSDLQNADDGSCPDGMVYLSAVTTGISLDRIFTDFGKLLSGNAKANLESAWRDSQLSTRQKVLIFLDELKGGRYVILLDNLESLQDPPTGEITDPDIQAFFDMALGQGSGLSILVTSREQLTLDPSLKTWERLIPLEEGLAVDDAILLLRACDPDGLAGLQVASDSKLKIVAEKTLGFPRALEAVAGALLEDSLMSVDDLLTDEGSLIHETSSILVQRAISRLNPGAIRVMEALSVFGRPVRQVALEFMLAPYMDVAALRAILNRLVRTYFTTFNKATQTFTLHPIDQEYCYDNLPSNDTLPKKRSGKLIPYTRETLHLRAAEYYRSQRKRQGEWKSIEDLEPQLSEIDHLTEAANYPDAAELLLSLDENYLDVWGHYTRLISLYERLQGKFKDRQLERKTLNRLAHAYYIVGNMAQASLYYEQALESARRDKDRQVEARVLIALASTYHELGHFAKITDYCQQALLLADELNDLVSKSNTLSLLGLSSSHQANDAQAIDYLLQALAINRQIKNYYGEGENLSRLGLTYLTAGQVEECLPYFEQAITIHRNINNRTEEGYTLNNLGWANFDLGNLDQAIKYHHQAMNIAREINNLHIQIWTGICLGWVYEALGEPEQARQFYQQTLDISHKIDNRPSSTQALSGLGSVQATLGNYAQAVEYFQTSIGIATEISFTRGLARAIRLLVPVLLFNGDFAGAHEILLTALQYNVSAFNHFIASLHGITLFCLSKSNEARAAFGKAIDETTMMLAKTPGLYQALYIQGLAKAGLALIANDNIADALADYEAALASCSAPGLVRGALELLDVLMACPTGERLQPIRVMLEQAYQKK